LAGLISGKLQNDGIDLILVGGACVSIYSKNRYQSYGLDFVTYEDLNKAKKSLERLGFSYSLKHFSRQDCPWFIEFVSPPVAIGDEAISKFSEHQTRMGTITMLTATDAVKDRLASYYHWGDRQGLEQAIDICVEVTSVDLLEVKRWSIKEGFHKRYEEFIGLLKRHSQ
jgi:hypothetical protein